MRKQMNQRERKISAAGRNLVERVKDYCKNNNLKFYDDPHITYVGTDWVGAYGYVGKLDMLNSKIEFDECLSSWNEEKKASNLLLKKSNKIYYRLENDSVFEIIVFSRKSQIGFYGKYKNAIIKMENDQLFDADNSYWFNVNDSKELLSDLRRGYKYYDPQDWFRDCGDDHECRWIQSKLDKGHTPLVYDYESEEWIPTSIKTAKELYNMAYNYDKIELDGFIFTRDQYEVYKYRKEED